MHQPFDLPEGTVFAGKGVGIMNRRVNRILGIPSIPGSGFPGIKSTGWETVRGGGSQLMIDGKVIQQGDGVRFFATGEENVLMRLLIERPALARHLELRVTA